MIGKFVSENISVKEPLKDWLVLKFTRVTSILLLSPSETYLGDIEVRVRSGIIS